ncbi:MAG: sensor histidine kinase [Rhodanobacter sp.]|nr:sensor histidine kinase [Rhodanobacter sp.]
MGQRSHALQRFIGGYAQLAKLPPPQVGEVDLAALCESVRQLLGNPRIALDGGPALCVLADGDQLEHVLINLLRNALEAGSDGPVSLRWRHEGDRVRIQIIDGGHGLPTSGNVFVPFFTTKPDGAGIGLALSRQIIEAQSGHLELLPREDAPGTVAQLSLPLATAGLKPPRLR